MNLDTLFDIFKVAIDREREAHDFYADAAGRTQDPEVKALFEEFSNVELSHERRLKEKYRQLKEQAG